MSKEIQKAAPKLKNGNDEKVAQELTKRFSDAQNGMRRIVALGLMAWEVKEGQLKHGQFGPWLAAHAPKLCRQHQSGSLQVSSALNSYMQLTSGVLETVGLTVNKYLGQISNLRQAEICQGGTFLTLPEKKVPKELLELRSQIFDIVDGKTAKQLFIEFKQAEETSEGKIKPKVGRLAGQGGVSAAQRERAKQAEQQAQDASLQIGTKEFVKWIQENADDAHLGRALDDKQREELSEAVELLRTALNRWKSLRTATSKEEVK